LAKWTPAYAERASIIKLQTVALLHSFYYYNQTDLTKWKLKAERNNTAKSYPILSDRLSIEFKNLLKLLRVDTVVRCRLWVERNE